MSAPQRRVVIVTGADRSAPDQLAAQATTWADPGTTPVLVHTPAELGAALAAIAESAQHTALVVCADAVLPDEAWARVIDSPVPIAALTTRPPTAHVVATDGSTVLSAADADHPVPDADREFAGLLGIAPAALAEVAAVVRSPLDTDRTAHSDRDTADTALTAIIRMVRYPTRSVPLDPVPGRRTTGADDAARLRAELAGTDIAAVTAGSAARSGDGAYSHFVLRRISRRLTPWAARRHLTPNTVTLASLIVGLAGAALFAVGSWRALIIGAVLLQLSIALDCVDGELARARRLGSTFGRWLDAATDRVKEYAALAGLAVAAATHGQHLWTVAAAAMLVQTTRHIQNFAFDEAVLRALRPDYRDRRPLSDHRPWQRPAGARPGEDRTPATWARRIAHMPIGERWLVLSVGALCNSPAGALVAYLLLVSLAALLVLIGALRRTLRLATPLPARISATLAGYRDDGLLARRTPRQSGSSRFAWLAPVAACAVEGIAAVGLTELVAPTWSAAAFGWFAAVAWHRYDLIYRDGSATAAVPIAVQRLGLGWLGRSVVLLIAAAVGVLPAVLVVGAGYFTVAYLPESLRAGLRTRTDLAGSSHA